MFRYTAGFLRASIVLAVTKSINQTFYVFGFCLSDLFSSDHSVGQAEFIEGIQNKNKTHFLAFLSPKQQYYTHLGLWIKKENSHTPDCLSQIPTFSFQFSDTNFLFGCMWQLGLQYLLVWAHLLRLTVFAFTDLQTESIIFFSLFS